MLPIEHSKLILFENFLDSKNDQNSLILVLQDPYGTSIHTTESGQILICLFGFCAIEEFKPSKFSFPRASSQA
jgi:hypothetical protein